MIVKEPTGRYGKDAYYFPHDSNAKDDPKCTMLIEQLGLEGYGIFWVLVETLREQNDYKYPLVLIPSIARKYNTTVEKVKAVINVYGLFSVEDDQFFFSKSLSNRMLVIDARRKTLSDAGRRGNEKRWSEQVSLSGGESGGDSLPIAGKERKGKEIKEKESKEYSIEQADAFRKFEEWIECNAPNVAKMKEPITIENFLSLKDKFSAEQIAKGLLDMHNWKPLTTKRVSANLTLRTFIKNDKVSPVGAFSKPEATYSKKQDRYTE